MADLADVGAVSTAGRIRRLEIAATTAKPACAGCIGRQWPTLLMSVQSQLLDESSDWKSQQQQQNPPARVASVGNGRPC